MNTKIRAETKSDFEKDFLKLMNNPVKCKKATDKRRN